MKIHDEVHWQLGPDDEEDDLFEHIDDLLENQG